MPCLKALGNNWTLTFDKNKIAIKVNDNDAPYRITELKNDIFKFLHLYPIDETRWERERTKFLKEVTEL